MINYKESTYTQRIVTVYFWGMNIIYSHGNNVSSDSLTQIMQSGRWGDITELKTIISYCGQSEKEKKQLYRS